MLYKMESMDVHDIAKHDIIDTNQNKTFVCVDMLIGPEYSCSYMYRNLYFRDTDCPLHNGWRPEGAVEDWTLRHALKTYTYSD